MFWGRGCAPNVNIVAFGVQSSGHHFIVCYVRCISCPVVASKSHCCETVAWLGWVKFSKSCQHYSGSVLVHHKMLMYVGIGILRNINTDRGNMQISTRILNNILLPISLRKLENISINMDKDYNFSKRLSYQNVQNVFSAKQNMMSFDIAIPPLQEDDIIIILPTAFLIGNWGLRSPRGEVVLSQLFQYSIHPQLPSSPINL